MMVKSQVRATSPRGAKPDSRKLTQMRGQRLREVTCVEAQKEKNWLPTPAPNLDQHFSSGNRSPPPTPGGAAVPVQSLGSRLGLLRRN